MANSEMIEQLVYQSGRLGRRSHKMAKQTDIYLFWRIGSSKGASSLKIGMERFSFPQRCFAITNTLNRSLIAKRIMKNVPQGGVRGNIHSFELGQVKSNYASIYFGWYITILSIDTIGNNFNNQTQPLLQNNALKMTHPRIMYTLYV